MPRKGKKSGKKSSKGSYRKTTSAKNVFQNRSAKSQSSQIYALTKRVNALSKVLKPEYKVYDGENRSYTFTSRDAVNTYTVTYFNGPLRGTADDQFIGNMVRSVVFDLYFTGEYHNSSETGYHSTESAGTPFRIIVLQRKVPSVDAVSISDVLSTSGTSGANYTMQAICPLKRGITDNFRILLDKKIIFTSAKNQALRHYRMRPSNLHWDDTGNCNGFVTLFISAGLHFDADFSEVIEGTVKEKFVYTDA